jgi:hypothetical protein
MLLLLTIGRPCVDDEEPGIRGGTDELSDNVVNDRLGVDCGKPR